MNKLKQYVKRTILASAKEHEQWARCVRKANMARMYTAKEAKAEGLRMAFLDATRGVDTGWWSDLIYTRDVYQMADKNRKAIAEAMTAFLSETGETSWRAAEGTSSTDILEACFLALSFKVWENKTSDQMRLEHGSNAEAMCDALMFGLKLAVEWYAQELASEMGVEL
jgi:hypothetical protein